MGLVARRAGLVAVAVVGVSVLVAGLVASPAPAGRVGAWSLAEKLLGEPEYPEDFFVFERTATGTPDPAQILAAGRQARRIGKMTRATSPELAAAPWRHEGPDNIGGRVVDIAVDPDLENTIYVATASGGVWKSTNAGKTYDYIWNKRWTQSMGAMVIASDGTLYAGTGETNPGGGSLTYFGSGMYKSTNRGRTWRPIGLTSSWTIGRVLVDPKDPDHVLVAASGNLFAEGDQRGLYETKDGGRSWKRILAPPNGTTGAVDVQMSPNGKNVYVAMWDHIRYPDWRDYAGPGSGIWRSTDGGKSFERLGPANGLPPPLENIGRIGLGLDPSDPDRLYAIYVSDLGTYQYWFASVNGGDTWFQPPGAPTLGASQSVYGWWFGRVWVDPQDSMHVYVGGVPLMESRDGGMSFPISHTDIHVDHHAMAWDPHKKGRVYLGNDGGVYRSEDNGAPGTWVHGDDQPWVQFYRIDASQQDPSRINGGLQDQGSVRSWGAKKGWDHYYGGDGIENKIHPTNKKIVFACFQYGNCARSENGGDDMNRIRKDGIRNGWLTPIEFQPGNPEVMYWAGDRVNRSEDGGRSWRAISPDLGRGELGREQNPLYAGHYGTVQAIGLNPADPQTIYAGTDNGLLWKTQDLGGNWEQIESEGLPERWITSIAVSPGDPDVLFVSFSGYLQADNESYVLLSRNGGKSWGPVSKNLPKAPVKDLALVGDRLFAATDVGVFVTEVGRWRWLAVGRGLPNVPVNDIEFVSENGRLYAGTFGHGVYSVDV